MRRVLLVGINKYPSQPLKGCINDVDNMYLYLKSKKFSDNEITILKDHYATKDEILNNLKKIVNDSKPGDSLLFQFSGHGVQIPSKNKNDEWDGLDECLCPYDFDWDNEMFIRDNKLQEIFMKLPKDVYCYVISDSCHSGTLGIDYNNKTMKNFMGYFKSLKNTSKTMPIPDHLILAKEIIANQIKTFNPAGFMRGVKKIPHIALISACESHQTASDTIINGKPTGALTYYLLEQLRRVSSAYLPMTTVVNNVRNQLIKNKYAQNPGIEGPIDIISNPFLHGYK